MTVATLDSTMDEREYMLWRQLARVEADERLRKETGAVTPEQFDQELDRMQRGRP